MNTQTPTHTCTRVNSSEWGAGRGTGSHGSDRGERGNLACELALLPVLDMASLLQSCRIDSAAEFPISEGLSYSLGVSTLEALLERNLKSGP